MKFLFVTLFTFCIFNFCQAQLDMDLSASAAGSFSTLRFDELKLTGQIKVDKVENSDIGGSPFWLEKWNAAMIYTSTYRVLIPKVKLNLYTNDVYYINKDGETLVVQKGQIKRVTFFKGDDTSYLLGSFIYMKIPGDDSFHFYQPLINGKAGLIKLNKVFVNKLAYDPISGKSDFNYITKSAYYLNYNGNMQLLRTLNKESVSAILKPGTAAEEWLAKNKNKLRTETDIIQFLYYFNGQANE